MLRNHLIIALRNLWRNKFFSALNIAGLSLGMACSLLIGLWIREEVRMDAFHEHALRTYYVMERQFYTDGKTEAYRGSPGLLHEEIQKKVPEIMYTDAFTGWTSWLTFKVGSTINKEDGKYAGKNFFRILSFPLLMGTPQSALSLPDNIAISRKLATRYFGSPEAAMGRSIRIENRQDYQVSAVFEDVPEHSSVKFDFLLPYQTFLAQNPWALDWEKNPVATLVQLRPDADPARVAAKLKLFLKNYRYKTKTHLFLQRYDQAYLHSNFTNGQPDGGRIDYVRLFSLIAVTILVIACINFINLATAQSGKRAKEVGIRKVMGAGRFSLAVQFMAEALWMTLLAGLGALILVAISLPVFNQLTNKHIQLQFSEPGVAISFTGLLALTTLLAGAYPAFFLSSFKPVAVLKGLLRFSPSVAFLRRGLVVVQFVFALFLMVGMFVIYQQLHYLQNRSSGFERENLLYVPLEGKLAEKYQLFTNQLSRLQGIGSVTLMSQTPTNIDNGVIQVDWTGKNPNEQILFSQVGVWRDFVKTLKLTVVQGRDFSPVLVTDTASFLINESAAKVMGFKDPVGQKLSIWGYPGRIIGVLKDFHFESLHTPIEPLIVYLQADEPGDEIQSGSRLVVRIRPDRAHQTLSYIRSQARQIDPSVPFQYSFADDEYQKNYESEQVVSQLVTWFTSLSVFISCLGLLGLATYTAEQRIKEIGIRKVLGASVGQIVTLLSRDFVRLVVIAFVIAVPIAWYAANQWLQGFAYRINIAWWIFALAGSLALLVALVTVSFQAIKAALANPVKSLRSE